MNKQVHHYAPLLLSLLLILVILTLYWPVQHYEFLSFDDQVYVTDNARVRSGLTGDNVRWAFGSLDAGFWHPLTWLSLMLDASLYRTNAGGFHWTNVLLHMGGTLLLFSAWRRMTGAIWPSAFVAALFALHPLNVEPVAWIASRKDVLSGFWGMLTLWTYARYAEIPHPGRYLSVLICFMLGLMSKPILVTLPVVMLLLDYWPLGRFQGSGNQRKYSLLILGSLPLAVCALAIIMLTFIAEHRFGAISGMGTISLSARISNALVSYLIYMGKMILPTKLAAYYPHPGVWQSWLSIGSASLLILLTTVAVQKRNRYPYLFVGWFWYLITLLPVIGLVQLGTFARADRYAYIPLIGLFIAVAWGAAGYFEQMKPGRSLSLGLALVILLALVVTSRMQVAHWQNGLTLFQHAINVTENNYKAYHGLGMAYHQLGDDEQAIKNIHHSLSLKPDQRAHIDLGFVYMSTGRFKDAEQEFTKGLKLNPDNAKAQNNLGAALASQEKYQESIYHFQEALRLDPGYQRARENLKLALDAIKAAK